jgi:predicted AlkP superfamily phosphohydrolase/phosphomutase
MNHATKVAVLGLDGVPFSLLQDFFAKGIMPRLAETAKSGTFLSMETSLPCVSSVAWTSFMTGKNPGDHGIFGFTDVWPDKLALRLPSFDDIRSTVIWNALPGKTSVVVNLPFTYPARPLKGILISGFVAPIFERSVYPESMIAWLKSRNYRIDVDAVKGRQDRWFLVRDLFETLKIHSEVMLTLMERENWDLFIGVITGTDRLHHFFFDAAQDPSHPLHKDFIDYYRMIDSFFSRFVERCGKFARLIVLSDHGFTRLKTQVYLNHILKTLGYISFVKSEPVSPEDIHPDSKAFAMDPSRIYLNLKERFSHGALNSKEAEMIRISLKKEFESLRLIDIGFLSPQGSDRPEDRVFTRVLLKEDIFDGKCIAWAPDLVVIPRSGYDPKGALNVRAATMTDIFTGMHTHDDAFLIVDDPDIGKRLSQPRITDVFGLMMEVLG